MDHWGPANDTAVTSEVLGDFFENWEMAIPDVAAALEVSLLNMYSEVDEFENCKSHEPSKWVMKRIKGFNRFLGVSFNGYKEEALRLFTAIEGRWRAKGRPNAAPQRKQGMGMKRYRELKNLCSLVNYET